MECSVTCGGGVRSRFKACINEAQRGEGSQGPFVDEQICNIDLCQTSAGNVIVYLLSNKTFFQFRFLFSS